MLKATYRRWNDDQENDEKDRRARGRRPLPPPQQIRKYGHRKNLDGGRERKQASRTPGAPLLEKPEPQQHQRQQNQIGLAEIKHIKGERDHGDRRQRRQPGTWDLAVACHRVRKLRHDPPGGDVEQRQTNIKWNFSEEGRDRQQDRRRRRIQKSESGLGVVRIEVAALQYLLAGPEPQRIILCLTVAEDLGTENVSGQDEAADQEKDIQRRP